MATLTIQDALTARIKTLYQQQFNHQIHQIIYHSFGNNLIILIENVTTKPEQLLVQFEVQELTREVRTIFDHLIQPQIKLLIEETISTTIIDFLYDTSIQTGRTGIIAIFEPILKESSNNSENINNASAYF
ncbi:MAG: DUF2294 domain-containing protein [Oscillatoriales cyanobacterium RM1_1_9]|nr:DUF2294 domain-containing protein [Oscillatoriales cyanobacterium SM2_3_0]NJO45573.1 DUF2294 domain-containing protein [Oscillatoriales cyanobacterium RM2_1_1]NJO71296.1 DUF2294 domain-containing protein [Oscillatoriales cyanobacterium RM1_1_9]